MKREKSYGIMNVIKIVCCWAMKNLNFISNKEFRLLIKQEKKVKSCDINYLQITTTLL